MEQLDQEGDLVYSEWTIKMCKVQWSHHIEDEATWEHKEELRADYLELFL
jgi:hypothetical protein